MKVFVLNIFFFNHSPVNDGTTPTCPSVPTLSIDAGTPLESLIVRQDPLPKLIWEDRASGSRPFGIKDASNEGTDTQLHAQASEKAWRSHAAPPRQN